MNPRRDDRDDVRAFLNSLPLTRKSERWNVVRRKLLELADEKNSEGLRAVLDGIAWIGRKWETQLLRLAEEIRVSAIDEWLTQQLGRILGQEIVFRGRDTGSNFVDLSGVLGRLEMMDRGARPILNVAFETPHAYVYGLCAVVAWASAHARDLQITGHPRVENFVRRAGVLEAFRDRTSEPVKFDTDTILGFTRIDPVSKFDTDAHAGRLVGLFRTHTALDDRTAQALSISFAELIENTVRHGKITTPAWLFANYHPQHRIMHICICDRGIGIRRTFEESSNDRLRGLAAHATHWIREATEPLVTSKSEGHAGYGLYLARELCRANGGQFIIVSGKAAFEIRPEAPDSQNSDIESIHVRKTDWNGTLVALKFRLDHPLDLGPIYNTLPSPENEDTEKVELFDD